MSKFLSLVEAELTKARKAHGNIRSAHEGLGILEEEFWELKQEVFKRHIDKKAMLGELVQVAAMCCKMGEDLGLVDSCCDAYEVFNEL